MAVLNLIAFDHNIVKYRRLIVNNPACCRRTHRIAQVSLRIADKIDPSGTVCRPCPIECSSPVFRHYIPDRILSVIAADIRYLTVFNINVMIGPSAVSLDPDSASFPVGSVIAPVRDAEIIDLPVFLITEINCGSLFPERSVVFK